LLLWQGAKLDGKALVAPITCNGGFLVLVPFAKKNQKSLERVPNRDVCRVEPEVVPSQVPYKTWLNTHNLMPSAAGDACKDGGNGHSTNPPKGNLPPTSVSEDLWHAIAADLASFHMPAVVDTILLSDGEYHFIFDNSLS
jgi:hypothetical protein